MKMMEEEGKIDVFNFVLELRRQRNYMVQTEVYITCYSNCDIHIVLYLCTLVHLICMSILHSFACIAYMDSDLLMYTYSHVHVHV